MEIRGGFAWYMCRNVVGLRYGCTIVELGLNEEWEETRYVLRPAPTFKSSCLGKSLY